jgi:small conductance mechanosensitive channel
MEPREMLQVAMDVGIRFGIRIVGAIALWIIGRAVIGFCGRLIHRWLVSARLDPTLGRYIGSAVSIVLNVVLVIAILGIFGVETTTFAAILAAAGVAIGVAWGGMLGNFAAGVFLVIFRPFKTGDFVGAGGVTGTVHEIGMFATTFDTPDNVRTIVGNNKVVGDTIQNFSANPYRRVDITAQLAHGVDVKEAGAMLKDRLTKIPNVLGDPAPVVEILQFTLQGPVLAVRPFCNNTHYWQVYFDTNRMIREAFTEAGFPVPTPTFAVSAGAIGSPFVEH